MSDAPADAAVRSRCRISATDRSRACRVGGAPLLVAPTSTVRCSPTATRAPLRRAAARRDAARRRARRAGSADVRTSCPARDGRWTTTGLQLEPVPLLRERGRVKVALRDETATEWRTAGGSAGWSTDAVAARRRAQGRVRAARARTRPASTVARADRRIPGASAAPASARSSIAICAVSMIPADHRHLLRLVGAADRVLVRGVLGDAFGRGRLPAGRQPDAVARRARDPRRSVGELPDPDRARVLHGVDGDELRGGDVPEPGAARPRASSTSSPGPG